MSNPKKTAIITGASSGLGEYMALAISKYFPDITSYWLVARREEALKSLAAKLPGKECKIIPLDLSDEKSLNRLQEMLIAERPDISLLINNAASGILCNVGDGEVNDQLKMIDLNVRSLTGVTHLCIPYIHKGGHIINISSSTAFCPTPRMTVYSASKIYIIAFTRGIREELRKRGIVATVVCPGLMRTAFLHSDNIKGESQSFSSLPYCDTEKVANGALRAAKKGKGFYTPTAFYKAYRVLAKILPHSFLVKFLTQ